MPSCCCFLLTALPSKGSNPGTVLHREAVVYLPNMPDTESRRKRTGALIIKRSGIELGVDFSLHHSHTEAVEALCSSS